jgi:hypothetical protein
MTAPRAMCYAVVACLVASTGAARADESGWSGGAVPFVNYDADAGFGAGAIGSLLLRRPDATPHRASLLLQVFVSSERVQAHELRWDVVPPGHPDLRVFGRAAYFATVNRNYCGVGNAVTCDPAVAEAAADAAGLAVGSSERDDFVRHFYRIRFVAGTMHLGGRWRTRVRALSGFAQWRALYVRPGTWSDRGPYPGSLYAIDHPDGEPGLISAPQVGVMHDTRDSESTPSHGHWLEASLRGAGTVTGSDWSFAGGNVTARFYRAAGPRVVSATRIIADGVVGSPPTMELGQVNGAESYIAFGGESAGRGIREQRYIGAIKLLAQEELRIQLSRRWVGVGFMDAGWIAAAWDRMGGDTTRVLWSTGVGLRYVRSAGFIVRGDLGLSPVEGWSPQAYLYLGHLY